METAVIMGNDKVKDDLLYIANLIENEHGELKIRNGTLVGKNDSSIHNNHAIVDKIHENMGLLATIFMKEGSDYRRISTNILTEEGDRAVNTFLGSNHIAYQSLRVGERFSGATTIFGK